MTESTRKLSDKEQLFLTALFENATDVDADDTKKLIKTAMEMAGYANSSYPRVVEALKHEIVSRAEYILAIHAPLAVAAMGKVLAGDTEPGVTSRMRVAETILDRIGLAKKDTLAVNLESAQGIFILPPKDE